MASKRSLKNINSNDSDESKRAIKKLKKSTKSDSTSKNGTLIDDKLKESDGRKVKGSGSNSKEKGSEPLPATPNIDRELQSELNKQLFKALRPGIYDHVDLDLVKQLVEKGADVNAKDTDGTPVLIKAVNESSEVVQYLLDSGADPHCKRADGVTFIAEAMWSLVDCENTDLLEMIFDAGARMNYTQDGKRVCPAIWAAISTAQENIIDFVLERGADVTVLDDKGHSVLSLLVRLRSDEVAMYEWELEGFKTKYLQILKSHGAKFTKADKKDGYHKTSSWKKSRPCMRWRKRFATARWRF